MKTNQVVFRTGTSPKRKKQIQDRHQALNDLREKQHAIALKPFLVLRNNYIKRMKTLINATEKKSASRLFAELNHNTENALLKNRHLPDIKRLAPIRKRFRSSFIKNFSKAKEIQRFRKDYVGDIVTTANSFLIGFVINSHLLDLLQGDLIFESDFTRFGPPFEFGENNNAFEQHTNWGDHSIVDLQTGFVSVGSHYSMECTPLFDWFDNPSLLLKAFNGVGATYTMPKTGILEVVVVAQNTRSHLEAYIEDNFGWSEGHVQMTAGIYLNVLHPNNIEVNEIVLSNLDLPTGGDDVHQKQDNLQTSSPFVLTLRSTGAFAQGEIIQLLAGSMVTSLTYLDDMTATQNLLVSWQIKEMFVRVV